MTAARRQVRWAVLLLKLRHTNACVLTTGSVVLPPWHLIIHELESCKQVGTTRVPPFPITRAPLFPVHAMLRSICVLNAVF